MTRSFKTMPVLGALAVLALGLTSETAKAQESPVDPCGDYQNYLYVWYRGGIGGNSFCTGLSRSNTWTFRYKLKRVRMSLSILEIGGCTWYFKDGDNWKKISSVGAGQNSNYSFDNRKPHHYKLKVNC